MSERSASELLAESSKYLEINKTRRKPKIYSYALNDAVNARIPPSILEAMSRVGWNPLGVFEVVEDEIRKEKKAKKNGTQYGGADPK